MPSCVGPMLIWMFSFSLLAPWGAAAQTYSLVLLGGRVEAMGYLGVDLPLGQDADSMAPPIISRKAPAQAMKMADPNSYLEERRV